jgi:hypothetical protein
MAISVSELLDREMIRDALANYSMSREIGQDPDVEVSVFREDSIEEMTDGSLYHGREEIKTLFDDIFKERTAAGGPTGFSRHWIYPFQFEFPTSGEAKTVSYMLNFSERGFEQAVTYYDDWIKDGETWYIKYRRITMEYLADGSRFKLANTVVKSRGTA